MADKEVKIDFKTKADTKGAKDLQKEQGKIEKGLKKVEKSSKNAAKASKRQSEDTVASSKKAERAIGRVEDAAEDLRREFDKIDGLDPKIKKQVDLTTKSMDRAAISGRKMATAQNSSAKSSKNSGLAALEFSRAVEDAQYGVRGILNNIPQLVQFMGGGAGLAGAISLAAVGLTQLVEQLIKTDDKIKDVSKTLEAGVKALDEYYEAAAQDGAKAMVASAEASIVALERQSQSLRDNLSLIREKRQAELEVAKASEDLELAQIASKELTGEFSDDQADEARKNLALKRLENEAEEKILKVQEDYQQAQDLRAENAKAQAELEARITRETEKRVKLIEERNLLRVQKEVSERGVEKAQKRIDKAGFLSTDKKAARVDLQASKRDFPESSRKRLLELDKQILPKIEGIVESLESTLESKQQEQADLSIAEGKAFKTAEIVEESVTKTLELKTQTIETLAGAEQVKESTAALAGNIKAIDTLSKTLGNRSEEDQKSVTAMKSVLVKALQDGTVTRQELVEINQVAIRESGKAVGKTEEVSASVSTLQNSVSKLISVVSQIKANEIRLDAQLKQLGGRQ